MRDLLKNARPGDEVEARQQNLIVRALRAMHAGGQLWRNVAGTATRPAPLLGTSRWFKAHADLVHSGDENGCYVMCYPVDNREGDNEDTGNDTKVWVPRRTVADPVVLDDQVILATLDSDDQWVAVGDHVGVFLCKVVKDGGVSGGAAAECTWTYTVKELGDATTIETGVTPEVPRYHYVEYWYAGETRTGLGATSTYALAAYDGATLKLLVCFGEIAKETACA